MRLSVCLSVCLAGWSRGRDGRGSVGEQQSQSNSQKEWSAANNE
jgi:hypothetical protein